MRLSVFKATLFAMAAALAANISAPLHAQETAKKREPHPTFAAFLEELETGQLEKAAGRIASVNDFMGLLTQYIYFSPEELVALLSSCDLSSLKSLRSAVAIEKTQWDCPDGERYSMIFNSAGDPPSPYLYVHRIETEESRKAREARSAERIKNAIIPPPPILLSMASTPEDKAALAEQTRIREETAARQRNIIGQAFMSGKLDTIAALATARTDAFYVTQDPYFDVRIIHINGIGNDDVMAVLRRARQELGKPVSVECKRGEGTYAPQICEWGMAGSGNSIRAEMHFIGPDGLLSLIRVFRKTAAESAQLRQQAIDLGVIEG